MTEQGNLRPADSAIQRYRAGLPARDEGEREAYREWASLDAEDYQSALEERLLPDEEYERYDGPLGWTEWRAERARNHELDRLGIERPLVPEPYASALGADRAERVERQVEDVLMEVAFSPPDREELSAQAKQFGATGRALNQELSRRVAELEERAAALRDELADADIRRGDLSDSLELVPEGREEHELLRTEAAATGAKIEALGQSLQAARQELGALAEREDHPDRWLEQHGKPFADAIAAQHHFRRERELASRANEHASRLADAPELLHEAPEREPTAREQAPATPDAGRERDLF